MTRLQLDEKYTSHHAWLVVPAWGHVTATNALIARMLELNEHLVVTVVHHRLVSTRAKNNISKNLDLPHDRLNIVEVGESEIQAAPYETFQIALDHYQKGWIQTLRDLTSGQGSWLPPTAMMLDQAFANLTLPLAKEICGPKCNTFMHWTPSASCLWWLIAPSGLGGIADYKDVAARIYENQKIREGREYDDILEQVILAVNGSDRTKGTVVHTPGMKDMYDYERAASNTTSPPGLGKMLMEMIELSKNTDGVISTSGDALEGVVIAALNKISPVFATGVQLSPRVWRREAKIENDSALESFLNSFHENEVLYISFGSIHFPVDTINQVAAVLEVLIVEKLPFIIALGSPGAASRLGEELIERINTSGVGHACTSWVDQQAILQHQSVGWFLSHGGWNSTCESVAYGVPLVFWPLTWGDQPTNAALLSQGEKPVAFELMQIRQGLAQAKAMRGDEIIGDIESIQREFRSILQKMRGLPGSTLRANVEELASQLKLEKKEKESTVIRYLASK